jgi:hypothetical protein
MQNTVMLNLFQHLFQFTFSLFKSIFVRSFKFVKQELRWLVQRAYRRPLASPLPGRDAPNPLFLMVHPAIAPLRILILEGAFRF